jgi:hypothetical protein
MQQQNSQNTQIKQEDLTNQPRPRSKYRTLIIANFLTIPTSIAIAVLLSVVFGEGGAYISLIFLPLFAAMWIVILIDIIVLLKLLFKKLAN